MNGIQTTSLCVLLAAGLLVWTARRRRTADDEAIRMIRKWREGK